MTTQEEIWKRLIVGEEHETLLRNAMRRVAHGLSEMINQPITGNMPRIKQIPIAQVGTNAGAPDAEMVGIYLRIESGLRGQAIMILPLTFALNLVDLVMANPRGSSLSLGMVERSALGEVGNLTLSYFLNAVSTLTGEGGMLQPSPPVVMVDMLGAILSIIAAPAAFIGDSLLVIETIFQDVARSVWIRLWILPDPTIDWTSLLS